MKHKLVLALMLVLILITLVPFEVFAETLIDAGVISGTSFQTHSFYGYGHHWVFYSESNKLYYRSSADDGVTWGAETLIYSAGGSFSSGYASICFDGTYVHLAYWAFYANVNIYYMRGLPATNGTITWGAADDTGIYVSSASGTPTPSIAIDTNGYPWIGYSYSARSWVAKSSTNDGTFTMDTVAGFPYDLTDNTGVNQTHCQIVALTSGKMAAVYTLKSSSSEIRTKRWTGSTWGNTAVSSLSATDYDAFAAVAEDDNVHIVMWEKTTYDLIYLKWQYSTNAYTTEGAIYAGTVASSRPTILRDTTDNLFHVFWGGDTTTNHIYYMIGDGSSWSSVYDLLTDIDGLSGLIDTDYTVARNKVGIYYQTTAGVKFKLLDEPFIVDTLSASPVGLTSATLRGEIMSLGFGSATERGFVLNTSPTLAGAWLEGNETGTFNVGTFTHGVTGLTMFQTYWYAAYASNEYGESDGNWTSFDTSPPVPTPPAGNITGDTATICNTTVYNFLALPITNTDIKLLWDWYPVSGNSSVQIAIRYKLYSYPGNTTDGTQIYLGTGDAYTHTNLTPGTTYYYRAWLLCGGNYSADYVQDWATTYGSSPVVSPPEQPGGWFQDPSCTAYSKIPLLSDALVAVTTAYGFPATTVCVMFTLLWIIVLGLAVFLFIHSAMMMIITIAVLIILASIMGLLPLWMIVIAICLGGISIYISSRT